MTTPSSNPPNLARGYTVALLSALILSTTAIFIRHLTHSYQLPALILAFWRELFVALTLLLVLRVVRPALIKIKKQDLSYLVIYGFVLAIFNSLWTLSVALNGASISTVLAYCSAGFTALLGWWFLKERLDWAKMLAVVLSLGGCVLVSDALNLEAWIANFVGILTGLLSGLFYAIYSLMGRYASQRNLNPWTTLLYTFSFGTVFLFILNIIPGDFLPGKAVQASDLLWLGTSLSGWGILLLLAAGPTLAGYGTYNISLSYLPSSVANLILSSEPVFTAVMAYTLFGEVLTFIQIIGGLMILAGVIFLRIYEGKLLRKSGSEKKLSPA
ncbi:MAG: EamA family transporter [Anaerolineales bacterium]